MSGLQWVALYVGMGAGGRLVGLLLALGYPSFKTLIRTRRKLSKSMVGKFFGAW